MSAAVAPRLSKADLHRVTSEEKLFHSDYNVPPGHAPGENEVRWALRGYLPPKHLRIDGYNYGIPEDSALGFPSPSIVKRESTSALMAGCFVPESGEMEHEAGVTQAHVTIGDPTRRVVKGDMSSRPSWGGGEYERANSGMMS